MKKHLLVFIFLFLSISQYCQTKKTIADLYINEANKIIEERIDFKQAAVSFNKALTYMTEVTSTKVAQLGALIYYETGKYSSAKEFVDIYFSLKQADNSEEYENLLSFKTLINKKLNNNGAVSSSRKRSSKSNRYKRTRTANRKRTPNRKRTSTTTSTAKIANTRNRTTPVKVVPEKKLVGLTVKVDKIYPFNKMNVGFFLKNSFFGIMDDQGSIILEAKEYTSVKNYEGFMLLMDKKINPTKIYCFNTQSKTGFLIPSFSVFNAASTNYGNVMLPRANGILIMYPNKSYQPMIFDLNQKKIVKLDQGEAFFKNLKDKKIIQDYSTDGKVQKNNKWYDFGGTLGGGIFALYTKKKFHVDSFLFSANGKVLKTAPVYQYFGAFHNNAVQAIFKNKTLWIDKNGKRMKAPVDKFSRYEGETKVTRLEAGVYQVLK